MSIVKIKSKPCGAYQTNCYIVTVDNKDFIIDAGQDATDWVVKNVKNPVAILNTHGHFDHIFSNKELKEKFKIPIYISKHDSFFLQNDPFGQNIPKTKADYEVSEDEIVNIKGVEIKFHFFPGHTPGCSAIEIADAFFSGDFIFKNSIGRVDFPYSNPSDMKKSIKKFLKLNYDKTVYTGHGEPTTIKREQKSIVFYL